MKMGIIGQKWLAHEVVFAAAPGEGDRLFRAAGERGVPAFAYKADGLNALAPMGRELLLKAADHLSCYGFIPKGEQELI